MAREIAMKTVGWIFVALVVALVLVCGRMGPKSQNQPAVKVIVDLNETSGGANLRVARTESLDERTTLKRWASLTPMSGNQITLDTTDLLESDKAPRTYWSDDNGLLALWSYDEESDSPIGVFDATTGQRIHTLPVLRNHHGPLTISADNQWAVCDFFSHNLKTGRDTRLDGWYVAYKGNQLCKVEVEPLWLDSTHILMGGWVPGLLKDDGTADPPNSGFLAIYDVESGQKEDLMSRLPKGSLIVGIINELPRYVDVEISDNRTGDGNEPIRTATYRFRIRVKVEPTATKVAVGEPAE
ncbi:MAG: hypothetical protein ABSE91_03135 [Patescibacteria group bacterium]|jgi:hypothetical protein